MSIPGTKSTCKVCNGAISYSINEHWYHDRVNICHPAIPIITDDASKDTCKHGVNIVFLDCPDCLAELFEDDLWEFADLYIDKERNT